MSHRLSAPVRFRQSERIPLPREFYARLCEFYQRQPAPALSPVWEGCQAHNKPLLAALEKRDAAAVESELEQLYMGHRVIGLDWGNEMYQGHTERLAVAQAEFERVLFALAASLGVVRYHNPEQDASETWETEAVVAACETALGVRLHHPGGGAMTGAVVGDRFIPIKLLYMAVTLASLQRAAPGFHGDSLEVGAGTGMLAYLMGQAAPRGIRLHTLDLPLTSVLQAYLLACAEGADAICLAGERVSRTPQRYYLHGLLPPPLDWGLVVNQDSLPEFPAGGAAALLLDVTRQTLRGTRFLSVNHESSHGAQVPVAVLMRDFPEWRLVQRSPYWGRAGWLEEVWERR